MPWSMRSESQVLRFTGRFAVDSFTTMLRVPSSLRG